MNENQTPRAGWMLALAMTGLSGVVVSCVSTQPYIHQNVQNVVRLERSDAHDFRYVNVTDEDGKLVPIRKSRFSGIRRDKRYAIGPPETTPGHPKEGRSGPYVR